MKRNKFIYLILLLLIVGCQNTTQKGTKEETSLDENNLLNTETPKVLVYNFHSTRRCVSCLAIGEATKKTLNTYFAEEMKQGKILHYIINVDEEKNAKLCEKYQAFGSGLYLTQVLKGKETTIDLTGDGFKFALNKEEQFIEILKTNIENLLKP